MKISYNWLKQYIDIDIDVHLLAEMLTNMGLEVDEISPYNTVPDGLENITIGYVKEVSQHPNADRLRLTLVDVGGPELLHIVCGAPNVAVGQKVPVATIGTTIKPTNGEAFKIKESKIRGELSQGMLCAEDEIGLGESHDGILVLQDDAVIGSRLSDYYPGYKDWTIEIGLTPNRVDASCHVGVARDLAALMRKDVIYYVPALNLPDAKPALEIEIEDKEACPRYSGIVVKNIKVGPSPDWVQNYMRAVGLSPINNIVDITNFVMFEMGQPLHAFDLAKIKGNKLIIKKSSAGTKFTTLDKVERTLDGTELMICNAEEPMAIGGVFGGLESGISDTTTDIFIESAYFAPSGIRRTGRKHGLFTDASFRFERGTDPNATIKALYRAATLIQEVAGGEITGPIYDEYPETIKERQISLPFKQIDSMAGTSIPRNESKEILTGLGCKILQEDELAMLIEVPTYKTDVLRPADLIEEILRVYSFDRIPFSNQVRNVLQVDNSYGPEKRRKRVSAFLADKGFFETYMLSFVSPLENELYNGVEGQGVLNPISADIPMLMSNVLVPGLKAVRHNINRQQQNVKLFNWANIHSRQGGEYVQQYRLGLWATGMVEEANWHNKAAKLDYYDMKAIAEHILALTHMGDMVHKPLESSYATYGMAYYTAAGKWIAEVGRVDDKLLKKMDIGQEVFYIDMDAEHLLKHSSAPVRYKAISRFPKVDRDLALIVNTDIQYGQIRQVIENNGSKLLKKVFIFDVYEGEQLEKGTKSYAVRMEFEDEAQTMEDKTIDEIMGRVVKKLDKELNVRIRQ